MPLTENRPLGGAIKPGDVLNSKNGKTIEVSEWDEYDFGLVNTSFWVDNTDAEG
jgi:hypothetical protein